VGGAGGGGGAGVFGEKLVRAAYRHESLDLLNRFIGTPPKHPLEFYIAKSRRLVLSFAFFLSVAFPALAWCVSRFENVRTCVRNYFQGTSHPLNVAVFRIVVFVLLAVSVKKEELLWFASLPAELIVPPWGAGWLISSIPAISPFTVKVLSTLFQIFCVAAAIGFFTRISAWAAFFLGIIVLGIPQFYGKVDHHHHLLWFAALLGAGRSADMISLDACIAAWRRGKNEPVEMPVTARIYGLPLRFTWLLMGLIYFFAGFWKLAGCGLDWALTDNVKYHMYAKWVEMNSWTPFFRMDHYPILYKMSGIGTLVFEMGFIFLIFQDRLRLFAAGAGLAFHQLTFQFMRISFARLQFCYVAFFDWSSILGTIGRRMFKQDLVVLYDGNCRICRRTMGCFIAWDVLGRIRYVNALNRYDIEKTGLGWLKDEALMKNMHVVIGNKVWRGFEAYRQLTLRLPVFWPLVPFLWLWPIPQAGKTIYRYVADSRTCSITHTRQPKAKPQKSGVGFVLLAGWTLVLINGYCGFSDRVAAWPFACYPTFGWLQGEEKDSFQIEVAKSTGEITSVDIRWLRTEIPSQKLWGMAFRIFSDGNETRRKGRLEAFWKVLVRENPDLANVTKVRFYKTILTTIPELSHTNPLRREMIHEI
jgi:predicted DCC family thiol-disulfide oxidoreductase YuxK